MSHVDYSGKPILTPADRKAIAAELGTVLKRDHEESAPLEAAAKKTDQVRTIIAAVASVAVALIAGTLAYKELRDKPTMSEMVDHIEARVQPVRIKAAEVDRLKKDADEIRNDVQRLEQVQDLILEQTLWQGDVVMHVAEKRRGPPPAEPESLKRKKREIMR